MVATLSSSSLLSDAESSIAELSAAVLNGVLYRVDEGYLAVDERCWQEDRATAFLIVAHRYERVTVASQAAGRNRGDRIVASGISAAWILGAISNPPAVHQGAVPRGARIRKSFERRLRISETVLPHSDLVTCAGVGVTSAGRTVLDLLGATEYRSQVIRRACLALAAQAEPQEVVTRLEECADRVGPIKARTLKSRWREISGVDAAAD